MGKAWSASISQQIDQLFPALQALAGYASPQSALAQPGSIAAQQTGTVNTSRQDITNSNIGLQGSDLLNLVDLIVNAIMSQSQATTEAVRDISQQTIEQSTASENKLTDVLAAIQAPLTQYLPYIVVVIIIFVIVYLSKK